MKKKLASMRATSWTRAVESGYETERDAHLLEKAVLETRRHCCYVVEKRIVLFESGRELFMKN